MPETVISYCTVDDVCAQFPRYARNQDGSIADATIQDWIDDAAAYIYTQFYTRKIDLGAFPSFTTMQTYILRMLNRESGTRDLAAALRYSTSAEDNGAFGAPPDAPKSPLTASRFRDGRFSDISRGTFDQLFAPGVARTVSITPTIQGSIAGGDTDPSLTTPQSEGLNAKFSKGMPF